MPDYAIGVDLGGTKIAAVLIDRAGQIIEQMRHPTASDEGIARIVERIAGYIRQLEAAAPNPVIGVGIGIPGAVDHRERRVIEAVNLGWYNVPIGDLLVEALGSTWANRLWVDKDANAAAVSELLYGAGYGAQHTICVMVGTGVGAGLIFDGRLYHGAQGGDGNIGHLIVQPGGDLCPCGKRGCIETITAGPAIARRARAAVQRGESSTLSLLPIETLTAVEVVTAAQSDDVVAQRILAEAGQALGIGLAYYVDLTNPERIIIGGGVSAAGDWLLDPLRQTLTERALPVNTNAVQVFPAARPDAGAIGAAALVWMNSRS